MKYSNKAMNEAAKKGASDLVKKMGLSEAIKVAERVLTYSSDKIALRYMTKVAVYLVRS